MDNSNIKVSVIMPIYNAGEYLERAVSDVLAQTLREIELICIDDGSTDGSLAIIKKMQDSDDRIRIVTENNAGPAAARNKGIVRARGEFIIFLDADDFYENWLLESLYDLATSGNLDMAVARFDLYNCQKEKFVQPMEEAHAAIFAPGVIASKNEYPDYIFESTTGYVWNKLFRASFIREKELTFDPELFVFEDVHFVCTALSLAERVGRAESVSIHHRVYSDQSRAKLFRKYYAQVPVVYAKIKAHLMHRGMYIPLAKSFLNLSAGRCYKIYNLLWEEAKEEFWNLLHSEYAAEFGWYNHEKSDFESGEVWEFVANIGIYSHAEYLGLAERGKGIDADRLDQKQVNNRIKSKKSEKQTVAFVTKLTSVIFFPVRLVLKLLGAFASIFKKKENKENI